MLHNIIPVLKGQTDSVNAMVDSWSLIEMNTITKLDPMSNKLSLECGKEFNYKALVIGTGFNHDMDLIPGLREFDEGPENNHTYVHQLLKKNINRNYYNGYHHRGGSHICYSPATPYKGEGNDFYPLYHESIHRQDKIFNVAARSSKIEYWTPNKEIFKFPYANEVVLDECHKRGIEVNFGWEMTSVRDDAHSKVAVFKNVDSGEVMEQDFTCANINPPSTQHQFLLDAGVCDKEGMVDVNRYTLQHNKYENIFAIGDAISGQTTRTYTGAVRQNPIVKHNVLSFLEGKDCNAIYDGYQYMHLYSGTIYSMGFSHLHDFEPAPTNDSVPHYGVFGWLYGHYAVYDQSSLGASYTSFNKNHGPPHWHYPARYDELEHNEYLQNRQIDVTEVMHPDAVKRQALLPAV